MLDYNIIYYIAGNIDDTYIWQLLAIKLNMLIDKQC